MSYRWYLRTPFIITMLWGLTLVSIDRSPAVPTYIFVGMLIAWAIFWLIASYFYRRDLPDDDINELKP